ncbi:hypothetical protein HDU96_000780 [Phlyctochytrium bullatum]|nr:hypothetical protein HDU96_000780 [Phlyctochytrium bullatum]
MTDSIQNCCTSDDDGDDHAHTLAATSIDASSKPHPPSLSPASTAHNDPSTLPPSFVNNHHPEDTSHIHIHNHLHHHGHHENDDDHARSLESLAAAKEEERRHRRDARRGRSFFQATLIEAYAIYSIIRAISSPEWLTSTIDGTAQRITSIHLVLLAIAGISSLIVAVAICLRTLEKSVRASSMVILVAGCLQCSALVAALVLYGRFNNAGIAGSGSAFVWTQGGTAAVAAAAFSGFAQIRFILDALLNRLANRNLTRSKRKLIIACYVAVATIALGGLAFHFLEDWDFAAAYSFCIITLLTIGYGNVSPHTTAGRVFLFVYFVVGTLNTGYLVSSIQDLAVEKADDEVQRAARWRKLRAELRAAHQAERERRRRAAAAAVAPAPAAAAASSPLQDFTAHVGTFFTNRLDPTNFPATPPPWEPAWRRLAFWRGYEDEAPTEAKAAKAEGVASVRVVVVEEESPSVSAATLRHHHHHHHHRPGEGGAFMEPAAPLAAAVEAVMEAEADIEAEQEEQRERERERRAVAKAVADAEEREREREEDAFSDGETGVPPTANESASVSAALGPASSSSTTLAPSPPPPPSEPGDATTVEADLAEDQKIQARFAAIRFRRTLAVFLVLWLVAARLFQALEPAWSYLDAVYFTFCTFSTVGYGDLVPSTPWAWELLQVFLFASIAAFAGLLGILTESVAANLARSAMRAQARVEAERRKREVEAEKRIERLAAEAAKAAVAGDRLHPHHHHHHHHHHRGSSLVDAMGELKRRSISKLRHLSGGSSVSSASSLHQPIGPVDSVGVRLAARVASPLPEDDDPPPPPPTPKAPFDAVFVNSNNTVATLVRESGARHRHNHHDHHHRHGREGQAAGTPTPTQAPTAMPRFRGIKGWASFGARESGQ